MIVVVVEVCLSAPGFLGYDWWTDRQPERRVGLYISSSLARWLVNSLAGAGRVDWKENFAP